MITRKLGVFIPLTQPLSATMTVLLTVLCELLFCHVRQFSGRSITVLPDVICFSCGAYPTLPELTGRGGISSAQIKHMKWQFFCVVVCVNFTHPRPASSNGHTSKCLPLTVRRQYWLGHDAPTFTGALHSVTSSELLRTPI